MRKSTKLMAGLGVIAGLAVAAAPLATFATEGSIGVDNLRIVVDSSCDLKTTTDTAHTAWNNYYYLTLTPGNYGVFGPDSGTGHDGSGNVASMKIVCNAGGAYDIKGVGTALSGSGNAAGDSFALADGNVTEDGNVYGWGAKFTVQSPVTINSSYASTSAYKGLPSTAQTIASCANATAAGETFTVAGYAAKAKTDQKAGEYTGTATYTVVYGAN
jgi:hypothetical protein